MAGVVIECLPWRTFLDRYDRPATLFYLDPPYFGCETDYGEGVFGRADFEEMAERLGSLRGHFVLSLNDTPPVRDTFAAFDLEPVDVTYTVAGAAGPQRAGELIITGGGGG